jgi:membrane protein DedA with SNARE-associated domain
MIEDTIRLLRRSPFTSRLAKFVPGFSAIAPLMAGLFKLAWWKFVALDAIGAVLWAASYVGLGWVFRGQLRIFASFLKRFANRLE